MSSSTTEEGKIQAQKTSNNHDNEQQAPSSIVDDTVIHSDHMANVNVLKNKIHSIHLGLEKISNYYDNMWIENTRKGIAWHFGKSFSKPYECRCLWDVANLILKDSCFDDRIDATRKLATDVLKKFQNDDDGEIPVILYKWLKENRSDCTHSWMNKNGDILLNDTAVQRRMQILLGSNVSLPEWYQDCLQRYIDFTRAPSDEDAIDHLTRCSGLGFPLAVVQVIPDSGGQIITSLRFECRGKIEVAGDYAIISIGEIIKSYAKLTEAKKKIRRRLIFLSWATQVLYGSKMCIVLRGHIFLGSPQSGSKDIRTQTQENGKNCSISWYIHQLHGFY